MNRSQAQSQLLSLGGPKTDGFTNGVFGLGLSDADTAEQLVLMVTILKAKGYVGANYVKVVHDFRASVTPTETGSDEGGSTDTRAPPPAPMPAAGVPQLFAAGNQALDRGHKRLGTTPQAAWVNGWGDIDRARDVSQKAQAAGQLTQFVAYFIPNRDNGQASAGGASSSQDYRNWGKALADAIRGSNAIVDLEPDALTLYNSTPSSRYEDLGHVGQLLLQAGAKVFLSAGHSSWLSADEVAGRSQRVGLGNFTGYSLNDSNVRPLEDEVSFGERLWALTNKAYIIDTSRAGAGVAPLLKQGTVVNGRQVEAHQEWLSRSGTKPARGCSSPRPS